jgi:hypothetical protein
MMFKSFKAIVFKVISIAALFYVAASSSSCSKPTEQGSDPRSGAVVIQGNKDKCKFDTALTPSGIPIVGIWDALNWEENQDFRFTSIIEITSQNNSNNLQLFYKNYCTLKALKISVAAIANGPGLYQTTSFALGKTLEATTTENINGKPVSCSLRQEAGTYRFSFDQDCLVIEGTYYVKRKN